MPLQGGACTTKVCNVDYSVNTCIITQICTKFERWCHLWWQKRDDWQYAPICTKSERQHRKGCTEYLWGRCLMSGWPKPALLRVFKRLNTCASDIFKALVATIDFIISPLFSHEICSFVFSLAINRDIGPFSPLKVDRARERLIDLPFDVLTGL